MCQQDDLDELISRESEEMQDRIHQRSDEIIESIRNDEQDSNETD